MNLNINNSDLHYMLTHRLWDEIFQIVIKDNNKTLYDYYIKDNSDYKLFFNDILKAYGTSINEPNDIKKNRRGRAGNMFLSFVEELINRRLDYKWDKK